MYNVKINRSLKRYNSGDYSGPWKPIPEKWLKMAGNWDYLKELNSKKQNKQKAIDMYQWLINNPGKTISDWEDAHEAQRFLDKTDCYECKRANQLAFLNDMPNSQCDFCTWGGCYCVPGRIATDREAVDLHGVIDYIKKFWR